MLNRSAYQDYHEYHESEIELRQGQAEPLEYCKACGDGIFPGENVWIVAGEAIHEEPECLERLMDPEVMTVEAWME